jgi:hypothetical protein
LKTNSTQLPSVRSAVAKNFVVLALFESGKVQMAYLVPGLVMTTAGPEEQVSAV